jgi:NADH dehydrogenase FAD-containing subunit
MSLLSPRFLAGGHSPRILIVGANFAGLAVAKSLSSRQYNVTLIDPAANVEWLPNAHELVSRRKVPTQLTHDRGEIIRRLRHEWIRDTVDSIEPHNKRLLTQGGLALDYDVLILATGNVSNANTIPGVAHHAAKANSIASHFSISNRLTQLVSLPGERPVVIVGAGATGLEILGEILRRYGDQNRLRLHLIESDFALLRRFEGLHEHLMQRMSTDITVHCGTQAIHVTSDAVHLDNGLHIPSRLTIWTAGKQGHPLLTTAGLTNAHEDAPVTASLQSQHHSDIFIIGDAARLPTPLEKQAYYAIDMGQHIATHLPAFMKTGEMPPFRPRPKPSLITFGDRDGLLVFNNHVLASPSLIGLKEAIYQYGYHELMPPRSPHELSTLIKNFRHGLHTLDNWRMVAGLAEARLFQAR